MTGSPTDSSHKKRPPQAIRAYGDRMGDGALQLSFTLPVPYSGRAKEAARRFAEAMGLKHVLVATMEKAGNDFAAAFHLRRLLLIEPGAPVRKRLAAVEARIEAAAKR